MTKPGADDEGLRPQPVTKAGLTVKPGAPLPALPDWDSLLPSLGPCSSMARFVNWFGLTSPGLCWIDLIFRIQSRPSSLK